MGTDTTGVINTIYRTLPERKQVCTFSATYTPALMETLHTYMRTPRTVSIEDPKVSLRGVSEYFKVLPQPAAQCVEDTATEVLRVLNHVPFTQCIIFFNDFDACQALTRALCNKGIAASCISAKLEQRDRYD